MRLVPQKMVFCQNGSVDGSMLVSSALAARPVIHELLIALLILITAPVTTMILMSAAIRRGKSRVDIPMPASEASQDGGDIRP